MSQLVISAKVHFQKGRRTRKEMLPGDPPPVDTPPAVPLRLPKITKLMALAIRFEQLVREGVVGNYAELARLGRVSRTRITQVIALLQLAPDIQEDVLFLTRVAAGKDPITERHVRPIAATADWNRQRKMWRQRKLRLPVTVAGRG